MYKNKSNKSERDFHVKVLQEELQEVCKQILSINEIITKLDSKVSLSVEQQKEENSNIYSIFNLLKSTTINNTETLTEQQDKLSSISSKITQGENAISESLTLIKAQNSSLDFKVSGLDFEIFKEETNKHLLKFLDDISRQNKLHFEYRRIIRNVKYIIFFSSLFFLINVLWFLITLY